VNGYDRAKEFVTTRERQFEEMVDRGEEKSGVAQDVLGTVVGFKVYFQEQGLDLDHLE